jgi:hypothetical protein
MKGAMGEYPPIKGAMGEYPPHTHHAPPPRDTTHHPSMTTPHTGIHTHTTHTTPHYSAILTHHTPSRALY